MKKTCKACLQEKDTKHFNFSVRTPDAIHIYCRKCSEAIRKKRRNGEKFKAEIPMPEQPKDANPYWIWRKPKL